MFILTDIRYRVVLVLLIAGFTFLDAAENVTLSSNATNDLSYLKYLKEYGYIDTSDPNVHMDANSISDYIAHFQRFAGLEITGEMNAQTRTKMQEPRCGVKDIREGKRARAKRYALEGSKWKQTVITYRIFTYSRKLSEEAQRIEIARAFEVWSKYTPLDFVAKTSGKVDIDIHFGYKRHIDCRFPFDGTGQVLAHAFFPRYGGDAHFDESERWTINIADGTNLFQVAAHEFGHSLGLEHSDDQNALMAPFYRGFVRDFQLNSDDITAIQRLYGTRTKPVTRAPLPPSPPPPPTASPPEPPTGRAVCHDSTIDAITTLPDGKTYAFKGNYCYRLNDEGVDVGYPKQISLVWKNVQGPIDAALTAGSYTYLFKGSNYWKFRSQTLGRIKGPEHISIGFKGIPNNVSSAFVWSGNGKVYIVKGKQYWRLNRLMNGRDYGYPRSTRAWHLPNDVQIDAAVQWKNGRTFFFSVDKYFRYNDNTLKVVTQGNYPRPTGVWWFGCKEGDHIRQTSSLTADKPEDDWELVDTAAFTASGGNSPTVRSVVFLCTFVMQTLVLTLT